MKWLLPRSLATQITVVLMVGLTVSHLISMAIYTEDRADILIKSGGHQIAHQIAAITRLIDKTPKSWRNQILEATNSPTLRVSITPEKHLSDQDSDGLMDSLMQSYLANLIGTQNKERVAIQIMEISNPPGEIGQTVSKRQQEMHLAMARVMHGQESNKVFHASVELEDRSWLNFTTAVPQEDSLWSIKTVLSLSLMAIGVIIVSVWIIRKVTSPLRVFTAASKRLGKDVGAPPLVVTGPNELQEATSAFNEMQHRLRQLVENRTQMLAAISHDLRTPITLLRLRAETVEDPEQKEKMQATLTDMENMISSTLSFAKEDAAQEDVERVDLGALLESICDDYQDTGKDVTVENRHEIIASCRPLSLRRAISNIIENSLRHGSKVGISIKQTPSHIRITLTDDGPGLPQQELEKVFTPFYRPDTAREQGRGGIGLGLSVVRSIIDKHGGKIELSNIASGGLRASIELPS